jgi:anaerobic magnesium-protoporphyrin IX monomethyl ester cyclase
MKKVLFTHSYFLRLDPKQLQTAQPYAPLGTLYAASLMQANGFEISFFDAMFAGGPEELNSHLQQYQPDYSDLR